MASKGGRKEKRTRENRSVNSVSGGAPANQKPKKGPKRKVHMNFAHFFAKILVCFSFRQTSTIHISNFCSGMPL